MVCLKDDKLFEGAKKGNCHTISLLNMEREYIMKQRYTNLDLLRILACFMVVVIHTVSVDFYTSVDSFAWAVFNYTDTAVRSSVPLFLMISGMLLMSREECSIKRLLTRSIPRLLFIFFLWSTLYAIDKIGPMTLLRNFDLKNFLKKAWDYGVCAPHLWYLPMFIGLYFLVPVLHAIRDKKKILMYAVAMFFAFAVIPATVAAFPQTFIVAEAITRFDMAFCNYAGYFILGYLLYFYRDQIRISNSLLLIIFFVMVAITGTAVQLLSMAAGKPQISLYDNAAIPTCLEACALFLLFLRIPSQKIDQNWNKSGWIQKLSKYTLFVYLLHPFVLTHLKENLSISPASANVFITLPTISVGVFVLCVGVAFVIDLIPGVRKILL